VLIRALKRGCDRWCHAGTDLAGGVYAVIYEFVMFLYYRFICILPCEFLDMLMGDAMIINAGTGIISPLGDGDGEKTSPVSFHGDGDGEFVTPRGRGRGAIPRRRIQRCHLELRHHRRPMPEERYWTTRRSCQS
jgi:hypothetical protein